MGSVSEPKNADHPGSSPFLAPCAPRRRRRLNGHIVAIAEKSGLDRAAFLSEVTRAVRIKAAV